MLQTFALPPSSIVLPVHVVQATATVHGHWHSPDLVGAAGSRAALSLNSQPCLQQWGLILLNCSRLQETEMLSPLETVTEVGAHGWGVPLPFTACWPIPAVRSVRVRTGWLQGSVPICWGRAAPPQRLLSWKCPFQGGEEWKAAGAEGEIHVSWHFFPALC